MTPVALDGAKLLILMAAGGVFALAGLWLMFRPAKGQGANIEMFGLKFQSSSAGLLVFLIGAVFLAVPVFVPEKPSALPSGQKSAPEPATVTVSPRANAGPEASAAPPLPPASSNIAPLAATAPGGEPIALPVRRRAAGREGEPNDSYEEADRLSLGDSVAGSLASREEDWFAVEMGGEPRLSVRVRSNAGACTATYLSAYSPDERALLADDALGALNTSETWTIDAGGAAWVFLRLSAPWADCGYELFTAPAAL